MARTVGAYSTTARAPRLQQVWQSMRVLRRFTTADLLTTAECGDSQVTKYVRALAQTGYLRLQVPRVSGRPGSRDVWQLVCDSGPQAPIRRKDGSGVYDPNTRKAWRIVPPAEADAADAADATAADGDAHAATTEGGADE